MKRCVSIDWLEVYCEESVTEYPCNAAYFSKKGYFVEERDYGTRIYNEMFSICSNQGDRMIEIRRNPASGTSSFKGLTQYSTHIRLVNWVCYLPNAVSILREFLLRHNYIFHRIFRIDVCYDFEKFDYGDIPAKVAKRIIEKTYLKINQGNIAAHGADNWASYDWESLSWGSPSSMVTTKMYNKTKELKATGDHKPYIYNAWLMADLLTDPINKTKTKQDGSTYAPEIWRVEFSIKSKADSWMQIKNSKSKKEEPIKVRHTLEQFDAADKLWQRFQELAYHYFRFKIRSYKKTRGGAAAEALGWITAKQEKSLQRKDRMPDKQLFNFKDAESFLQVQQKAKPNKPYNQWEILKRRLQAFKESHPEKKVRDACDTIIKCITNNDAYRYTPNFTIEEVRALQAVISLKQQGSTEDSAKLLQDILGLIKNNSLW